MRDIYCIIVAYHVGTKARLQVFDALDHHVGQKLMTVILLTLVQVVIQDTILAAELKLGNKAYYLGSCSSAHLWISL